MLRSRPPYARISTKLFYERKFNSGFLSFFFSFFLFGPLTARGNSFCKIIFFRCFLKYSGVSSRDSTFCWDRILEFVFDLT